MATPRELKRGGRKGFVKLTGSNGGIVLVNSNLVRYAERINGEIASTLLWFGQTLQDTIQVRETLDELADLFNDALMMRVK